MQCGPHYNGGGSVCTGRLLLYIPPPPPLTLRGVPANIPKNVQTIAKERGREEEEQENTNFESSLLSALADLIGGGSHDIYLGRKFSL